MAGRTIMTGTTAPHPAAPAPTLAPGSIYPDERPGAFGDPGATHSGIRERYSQRLALLISVIAHTLLLILLALFTYRGAAQSGHELIAKQGDAQGPSELLNASIRLESVADVPESATSETTAVEELTEVVHEVSLVQPAPELPQDQLADLASSSNSRQSTALQQLPRGGGLDGRSVSGRIKYGRLYGATSESERAVDEALAWLARHQRRNGSWSFDLNLDPCGGQCRHGRPPGTETPTPSTAATGLALLAFLGAGHTHDRDGPYRETVHRGLYYLRSVAGETQAGYDWQQGSMYGHGIALMALAEAYAMTSPQDQRDAELHDLVARGVSFTSVAQHRNGSWGYVPGSPGDITVTGWQVLSLMAAKRKGIHPHSNTLRDAKSFVMSTCTDRDYWFGYKAPPGEPTTTAIGLTMCLYLGESPAYTPFYLALTDLANRGPMKTNIYHDYYGTLALHHSRHHLWDDWNRTLRDHLVNSQATEGHERGSWHFDDQWGNIGGRLYTTALCAMTLEIYYRYLPLYESIEKFPL